jgi:peptide subunit release factor 1 (eRF1)
MATTVTLEARSIRERLGALTRLGPVATPVVSVYLNTHWSDEQQRDRVRAFLKNEIRRAREAEDGNVFDQDLRWIDEQGELVIRQAQFPEAHGVAFFACGSVGLREVLPVRVPFTDSFSVGPHPVLAPLGALLDETPPTLVVFVDGKSARLVPLYPDGRGEEVALEHEVERRHRRGGWALLAQSRYQRHIAHHRAQHFEAVADTLGHLVIEHGIEAIVLAGEPRAVAVFRACLPRGLAMRVAGAVPGTRHEPAAELAARAMDLLARVDRTQDAAEVAALITEAAKGGRAVVGLAPTLSAIMRGAVRRLYLGKTFSAAGRECVACGALDADGPSACPLCGGTTREVGLGDAMVNRVVAAGGDAEFVGEDCGLTGAGAVAALLRYPLGGTE